MALAQIGPLTMMLEAVATAMGAGAVLCSLAAGATGLTRGKRSAEDRALVGGYLGGGVGVAFALIDVLLRYGG